MSAHLEIIRLTQEQEESIKAFDCGDNDLNDFIHYDSFNYIKSLMAVTYLIIQDETPIAFFSLLNDKIARDPNAKGAWRKIKNVFPHNKHRNDYPAVKIGRLGVSTNCQRKGLGHRIIDYIKLMFIEHNKTGCCFITVDAYKSAESFYKKQGFKRLCENKKSRKNKNNDTILMYYNLKELVL